MLVLIGLWLRGILQTPQKSQLSLRVSSWWITRLKLASLVPGCTTALYNLKMADNGVEPRTFTTAFMGTFPMPTPHVASFLVSSYVSAQLPTDWVGSVALDLLCGRAYSPAHPDKSSWAAVSCPLAIEGVQSQTELLPPSLHSCEDYWQLSAPLPVIYGHLSCLTGCRQLPGGNRLSPRQLGLISSPIHPGNSSIYLSSSFIWKWPLGWPSANLACCLRNHEQTLMCTKACLSGKAFAMGKSPCTASKQVKFRPSQLFCTGCLSLHSCQTAMFFGT